MSCFVFFYMYDPQKNQTKTPKTKTGTLMDMKLLLHQIWFETSTIQGQCPVCVVSDSPSISSSIKQTGSSYNWRLLSFSPSCKCLLWCPSTCSELGFLWEPFFVMALLAATNKIINRYLSLFGHPSGISPKDLTLLSKGRWLPKVVLHCVFPATRF